MIFILTFIAAFLGGFVGVVAASMRAKEGGGFLHEKHTPYADLPPEPVSLPVKKYRTADQIAYEKDIKNGRG